MLSVQGFIFGAWYGGIGPVPWFDPPWWGGYGWGGYELCVEYDPIPYPCGSPILSPP